MRLVKQSREQAANEKADWLLAAGTGSDRCDGKPLDGLWRQWRTGLQWTTTCRNLSVN